MLWKSSAFQGFQTFMPCPQGVYGKILPTQKLIILTLDIKQGIFRDNVTFTRKIRKLLKIILVNVKPTKNKGKHGGRKLPRPLLLKS